MPGASLRKQCINCNKRNPTVAALAPIAEDRSSHTEQEDMPLHASARATETSQDSKVAVLESKLNIYEDLSREMLAKLEAAVEKISEGNNRIAQILTKHDERIEQSMKTDSLIDIVLKVNAGFVTFDLSDSNCIKICFYFDHNFILIMFG